MQVCRRGMRRSVVLAVILLLPLAAAEGGVNEAAETEGTAVASVETADVALQGEDFGITVTLDDEAASNGTTVGWTTQICINTGVCYPPETNGLTDSQLDGSTWEGSVLLDETGAYVNWRIELEWPDGNTSSVPETGFGWKVWSTCWYDVDSEQWGGEAALDDGCAGEPLGGELEEEGWLPGFGGALAAASMAMAAFMARRD